MSKILLTGSTGFLGGNLRKALLQRGDEVVCYYRGQEVVIPADCDIVIHAAAEVYNEPRMWASNVLLTWDLLRAAERVGVKRFVYFGSSSEYGRCATPMSEQNPIRPTTLYEASKGCGSLLCQASKLNTLIVRPFSIYGPGEALTRFIPKVYTAITQGLPLKVGPGSHDFMYVDDLVRGVLLTMDVGKKDVVNMGCGIQYTNEEVVNFFEVVLNKPAFYELTAVAGRTYDTNYWVCDTSYVAEEYKFSAGIDLQEGLRRYAEYRQSNEAKDSLPQR